MSISGSLQRSNKKEPAAAAGITTANNGLTVNPAGNVQLGGTLVQNTTIEAANFILYINKNTGSSNALIITGNDAVGLHVTGRSANGAGIIKNIDGNVGLWASSENATTNTILTSLRVGRYSTGTAADGIGGQIEFNIQASDGSGRTSNLIRSEWTTANLATRTSQLKFIGFINATVADLLVLSGNGAAKLSQYGIGTFAGTPVYNLGVDASGNVVEGTASGGALSINTQTVDYTLALADAGKLVEMNLAGANNLTVPANATIAFPIGTSILISQYGGGQTSILPDVGVTVRSPGGALNMAAQYSMATLVKRGTNEWYLSGDIAV